MPPLVVKGQTYLGIDPGGKGGMAVIFPDGQIALQSFENWTDRDVWDRITAVEGSGTFAVLEKVGGYIPGAGGNIGSRMFEFGQSYGMVKGFLVATGIPFEEVTPPVWQKAFGLRKGKDETKSKWKARLRAKAQELFPTANVTLGTCDALLLAEYNRRKREGRL
jgi:hypothetical protein